MPSGPVHAASTIASATSSAVGIIIYKMGGTQPLETVAAYLIGKALGLMLTPDLDVDVGTPSARYIRAIPAVGPFLAKLWTWYWRPYAKLMPHRSFLSHGPIISTLIRVVYAFWPVVFVTTIRFDAYGLWLLLMAFVGLVDSDMNHWWLDKFTKEKEHF